MLLTRLTLKLTLIPALIFVAIIALIRSQPYDDSELRAFLTPPEGCPAPCFMGIRPGVTTAEEALAILERHEWIRSQTFGVQEDWGGQIIWEWDNSKSDFLQNMSYGELWFDDRKEITFIYLNTHIPIGNVWLEYGVPETTTFTFIYPQPGVRRAKPENFWALYTNYGFGVLSSATCRNFWHSIAKVEIREEEIGGNMPQNFELSKLQRIFCGIEKITG